jgi:hypothetical protein
VEVVWAVERRRHDQLWRLVGERVERRTFSGWAGVVCDLVVEEVAVDAAAISVRTPSRSQELVAASDSWARVLEELQYMLGEGPGAAAFADGGPVLVSDLESAESRWPGFVDAAADVGLGAAFAFPLQNGAIRLGTLDLYRRRSGALSEEGLSDVAVLADLATTALLTDVGNDQVAAAPWARPEAPGHYYDVNVATGMLAAELRISLDEALTRIRAHAFSNNLPLLDVARAVLARRLRSDAFHD